MPKIYRVMQEEDGQPKIGSSATTLGVRVPKDIAPDEQGYVAPGKGGMSVSPSRTTVPYFLLPKKTTPRNGSGGSKRFIWTMGVGPFVAGEVTQGLDLRPDPDDPHHGFVEPAGKELVAEYGAALQATRSLWKIAEE